MSNRTVIHNMRETLLLRAWPTLVLWNRTMTGGDVRLFLRIRE